MASAAKRVAWIREISAYLSDCSWTDENMILDEFDVPAGGSGHRDDIRSNRLRRATDSILENLWRLATGQPDAEDEAELSSGNNADILRIWGQRSPRAFLSHRVSHKLLAHDLKEHLGQLGIGAFVAHDDIEPTRAWQLEIEKALSTMQVLVALVSEDFAASPWTNQEIGVALGRGCPVVSVSMGADPPGFAGHKQALPGRGGDAKALALDLLTTMAKDPGLAEPIVEGVIVRWREAATFVDAIQIMGELERLHSLDGSQLDRIKAAYQENDQLHGAGALRRRYPEFLKRFE